MSPLASFALSAALGLSISAFARAQAPMQQTQPAQSATEAKADEAAGTDSALAPLAWLGGCWRGSANQREFREHWLPLRGNLLVGAGHTVAGGRTQDYEFVRIELRADGVYYVAAPRNQKETAFKLADKTTDGPDEIFTFQNPAHDFPQTIIYRRAKEGWLYVHVEGKLGAQDRRVIYPFRRIDCESGELITQ
jgi:hypothetical protein